MNRIPSTGVPVVPAAMNANATAVPEVDAGAESRNGAGLTSQRENPKGFAERAGLPFSYQPPIERVCNYCGGKCIGRCSLNSCNERE